jgi:hypothetical protein
MPKGPCWAEEKIKSVNQGRQWKGKWEREEVMIQRNAGI